MMGAPRASRARSAPRAVSARARAASAWLPPKVSKSDLAASFLPNKGSSSSSMKSCAVLWRKCVPGVGVVDCKRGARSRDKKRGQEGWGHSPLPLPLPLPPPHRRNNPSLPSYTEELRTVSRCSTRWARWFREDVNVAGVQPSFDPTVL
jgi:hypothetical protein